MFAINFFIKIREICDYFYNTVIYILHYFRKFFKKKTVFITDKPYDCENIELIDGIKLFEKFLEQKYDVYYIVSPDDYRFLRNKYGKRILKFSKFFLIKNFVKFLKLSVFITSYEFNTSFSEFLYKEKSIDYIFLQHGITMFKKNVFDIYNANEFNKVVVSNDIEANLFKKYGNFSDSNLIKASFPRFDFLSKKEKKEIFLFPTWRLSFSSVKYEDSLYYNALNSLINNERLKALLDSNNIILNIALHHSLADRGINLYENLHVCSAKEISSIIGSSALLITDYSSVWGDFFFMNRPVIFYRPDRHDAILTGRDIENFDFADKFNDLFFNIVYEEESLINLVEHYINNNFTLEKEFQEQQNKFFYLKSNIRETIIKEVFNEKK